MARIGRPPTDDMTRFWAKVDRSVGDCWIWTAWRDRDGYGRFRPTGAGNQRVHRFSYERFVGPIPDGLQLDHLCRQPACVNPAHLEPVTAAQNAARKFTPAQVAHAHGGASSTLF